MMPAIYCVTHKPIDFPTNSKLHCLQVGNEESFALLRDDVGQNIAEKNSTYSENTAFYWVWKNRRSDYVGFSHYRRFLIPPTQDEWFRSQVHRSSTDSLLNYASGYLLSPDKLFTHMDLLAENYSLGFVDLLQNHDIVLPKHNRLPSTGFIGQYAVCHTPYPFFQLLSLMAEQDRALGTKAYEFFAFHKETFWNNLFILPWDLFDDYCRFLFYWLFKLEKQIVLPHHAYQKRVFAFLSERLLNFWIHQRGLKIAEVD